MFKILRERFRQGYRTFPYLKKDPVLPQRFRGRPLLSNEPCATDCHACRDACPYGAINDDTGIISMDLGLCTFCGDCAAVCTSGTLRFSRDHRLATRSRDDLLVGPDELRLAAALEARMKKLFGRSLKLRQVSAGGCNACEGDVNVLGTLVFDLGRYGIQFVVLPRHADGLLVTGPVTENMKSALLDT